jgi:protein-tyrosine phosphatase
MNAPGHGKTYADHPKMREKFRRPTFAVGGFHAPAKALAPTKGKKVFMTEDECLELENEGIDPAQYIQSQIKAGTSSLDLGHMKLKHIPDDILGFGEGLTKLTARKNGLLDLPPDFGVLCALSHLDLQCNRLQFIPSSIAMLEHLVHLDLSNNQLRSLPDELEDLVSLQSAFLDFNYLESFPAVLLKIKTLQRLYVIENAGIASFPPIESFANVGKLLIHMDNTPELAAQWDVLKSSLPTITLQWNKIWPDKVMDGLFIGSLRAAQNASVFSGLSITNVVTCGRNLHTNIPSGVKQLVLDVDDNDDEKLNAHFHKAIAFMLEGMKANPPGNVLVHCFAGVSRSATIVIAFLMHEQRKTFSEAMTFVREQRPAINPNQNFCRQLQDWESECLQNA